MSVHGQIILGVVKPWKALHGRKHTAMLWGVQLLHRGGQKKNYFCTTFIEGEREPWQTHWIKASS